EHQAPMPDVPGPETYAAEADAQKAKMLENASEEMRRMMNRPRPIEMLGRDNYGFGRKPKAGEPKSDTWMRAVAPIGDEARMHQVILAYASDMNLLSTAMRPHGVAWQTPGLQSASLDHAMWFHKPSNFNDWHLYTQDSPSASGGRGFVRGAIYDAKGELVASVAQEGLMRLKK
ncbi:acyl-CoA thioesterase II, partial [Phenylobacterium sp.]